MATITDAYFDKTGTLTSGRASVAASAVPGGQMQSLAKSLALRSTHPASKALADYFSEVPGLNIDNVVEVAGCGIQAVYQGKNLRLGRARWVAEISAPTADTQFSEGVAFAVENEPVYVTRLSETLRPNAAWVTAALEQDSVTARIISGDSKLPVTRVASQIGVRNFDFDLRPSQKLDMITAAEANGHKIVMVGDGLNDAPALAAATVSIAPSTASDVGRSAADFVFTRPGLEAVIHARDIALATNRIVLQNFGLAIAYNIIAVPLAMAGQLNPLLAAVAMSTSSIIVVGNSLRLHLLKLRMPVAPEAGNAASGIQHERALA